MVGRGKGARVKGHNYERKIMKELIEIGYKDCKTSRYANREMDDLKVDLVNTGDFNIQCKAVESAIQYNKLLEEMPKEGMNVIMHKRNRKEFVVMDKESFYKLVEGVIYNGHV